jgi:hypothetical protein
VRRRAEECWEWLRHVASVGRRIVVFATVLGVAFFLRQILAEDEDLYPAFLKGLGAMFATMVVTGAIREFWRDRRLKDAQGPGGTGGLGFDDETQATQRAVDELNTRVTTQMDDVNKRLYDLETAVFKPDEPGDHKGK